jgi:cbb3-type cytochrome oxidase subunit 3
MNPVFREASALATGGTLMGATTVGFFLFFMRWLWWLYRPGASAQLHEAAHLPLDDTAQTEAK